MKKISRMTALFLVMLLSVTMILPASAAEGADVLKNISYYGDLAKCKMTAQQAEAFAAVIRSEEEKQKQKAEEYMRTDRYFNHSFDNQVAFVDIGNGIPAMLFFSSLNDEDWDGRSYNGGYNSLWQWSNGKVVRFLPTTDWLKEDYGYPEGLYCHLYSDHILVVEAAFYMSGQILNLAVFPFRNGQIAATPSTTAYYLYGDANAFSEYPGVVNDGAKMCYEIDGKTVSESQIDSWMDSFGYGDVRIAAFSEYYDDYNPKALPLAGYDYSRQGAYTAYGMSPAKEALTALDSYAKSAMVAGFKDILANDWFANDVKFVVDKKLMNGTGEGKFTPNGTTTRGQAVTILYRLAGSPSVSGNGFSDVKSSDWFAKAVRWASQNGIASGYGNGRFGPNDILNREQLATMLYRYAQFKSMDTATSGGLSKFSDSGSVSGYAVDAMSWAVSKGLISGTGDGKLAPGSTATRAQLAAILHRFCENVK